MQTVEHPTIGRDDKQYLPLDRSVATRPLRVLFIHTSMPVGGAETLTANLIRRLDRERFAPEIVLLEGTRPVRRDARRRDPGSPRDCSTASTISAVWPRLTRLLRDRQIDAVVTVGAGRQDVLGPAGRATGVGVPVVLSALHSTGWPDGIGRLNRLLTPLTDALHRRGRLARRVPGRRRRLPGRQGARHSQRRRHASGSRRAGCRPRVRRELGHRHRRTRSSAIVAALRPEKNHELFLEVARPRASRQFPTRSFSSSATARAADRLEAAGGRTGHCGERPLPRHAQRRAAAALRHATCSRSLRTTRPIRSRSSRR